MSMNTGPKYMPGEPAKESAETACRAVRAVNGGTCEPSEYRWCSPCGKLLKDADPCFKSSEAQAQVDLGDGIDATSQAGCEPAAADPRVTLSAEDLHKLTWAATIEEQHDKIRQQALAAIDLAERVADLKSGLAEANKRWRDARAMIAAAMKGKP